ncbi:beta-1,6-N-acetylglucosaminyltransferase [Paenibacillus medicaginis]|uniref:Peptide O-xylosyltransferase n=1 Tax=Paenibacillus medicaginis TaxID=1470560 RepID=A0ABV5BXZ4_9BACL
MKIAYFILAHHKPTMLNSLLQSIYDESNIYMIHVDAKSEEDVHRLAIQWAESFSNIHILHSRSVTWGCWSLVQLELDAIKELLRLDVEWTHYINLSGQDLPLVSQLNLKEFLETQPSTNFIQCIESTEKYKGVALNNFFIEDVGELKILGERPPFEHYFIEGMKAFNGSQWRIITREFAHYAVYSPLAFDMQDYFRYSHVSDEQYFQTLAMNSPFREKTLSKNFRYIVMSVGKDGLGRANTLQSSSLFELFNSDVFFARKFDDQIDPSIIQVILQTLGSK